MIDTNKEKLLRIPDAASVVNPDRPPHTATVWRWILDGLSTGVRLESIKIGGLRFTSREAIERFKVACNANGGLPAPAPTTSAQRAKRELIARGA